MNLSDKPILINSFRSVGVCRFTEVYCYWADAIIIALAVYYKKNLHYTILHIKNEKNSHITITSKTRRDEKEKNNADL